MKPKDTEKGSLSLLQEIFPTQELNQGLLHCRRIPLTLHWCCRRNWSPVSDPAWQSHQRLWRKPSGAEMQLFLERWVWSLGQEDLLTRVWQPITVFLGFPCGSVGKESSCSVGDLDYPWCCHSYLGEGKGYPLQCSGLENSMDCIVHGVAKSWIWLSYFYSSLSRTSLNVTDIEN